MGSLELGDIQVSNMNTSESLKPNHTGLLPNFMATLIFFAPGVLFVVLKLTLILMLYYWIIIFLLVSSISNIKWKNER